MIEIFTSLGMTELGAYLVSIGSPILSLVALVVVALMVIYKTTKAINELRNTNEIKELVDELKTAHTDNAALRKINKKLLQELSRKIYVEDADNDEI